jgi:hypothetical protein
VRTLPLFPRCYANLPIRRFCVDSKRPARRRQRQLRKGTGSNLSLKNPHTGRTFRHAVSGVAYAFLPGHDPPATSTSASTAVGKYFLQMWQELLNS